MSKKKKKIVSPGTPNFDESDFENKLRLATKNLYYISESDAEILVFTGDYAADVTKDEIVRQTGKLTDVKIEEREFSEIFSRLTKIQNWFGEEDIMQAKKFKILNDLFLENLTNIKVFKIGEIEIEIYFVGLDKRNRLMGIHTKSIET